MNLFIRNMVDILCFVTRSLEKKFLEGCLRCGYHMETVFQVDTEASRFWEEGNVALHSNCVASVVTCTTDLAQAKIIFTMAKRIRYSQIDGRSLSTKIFHIAAFSLAPVGAREAELSLFVLASSATVRVQLGCHRSPICRLRSRCRFPLLFQGTIWYGTIASA